MLQNMSRGDKVEAVSEELMGEEGVYCRDAVEGQARGLKADNIDGGVLSLQVMEKVSAVRPNFEDAAAIGKGDMSQEEVTGIGNRLLRHRQRVLTRVHQSIGMIYHRHH